eukprot:1053771-Pleurochrysis_carterae.AAC.2
MELSNNSRRLADLMNSCISLSANACSYGVQIGKSTHAWNPHALDRPHPSSLLYTFCGCLKAPGSVYSFGRYNAPFAAQIPARRAHACARLELRRRGRVDCVVAGAWTASSRARELRRRGRVGCVVAGA